MLSIRFYRVEEELKHQAVINVGNLKQRGQFLPGLHWRANASEFHIGAL